MELSGKRTSRRASATHVGFADEANWNVGHFRSVCLVTTPAGNRKRLDEKIRKLLTESEFKWSELRGERQSGVARELCQLAIEEASNGTLRIDVLVWNIKDSRHDIRGRDDRANLGRMYYHLFHNVLGYRWPDNAVWSLYLDENSLFDWKTIRKCLRRVGSQKPRGEPQPSLGNRISFGQRLKLGKFWVKRLRPVDSRKYPLIQLADLFAGLAVFSHHNFAKYREWLDVNSDQRQLFAGSTKSQSFSHKEKARFKVLKEFHDQCRRKKLKVILDDKKGLRTPDPSEPINFWFYTPQHQHDKAPTKVLTAIQRSRHPSHNIVPLVATEPAAAR